MKILQAIFFKINKMPFRLSKSPDNFKFQNFHFPENDLKIWVPKNTQIVDFIRKYCSENYRFHTISASIVYDFPK